MPAPNPDERAGESVEPYLVRAARRLDVSLPARLYYASMMAEIAVMPEYTAHDPASRDRQTGRIARHIELDHAVLVGVICGYNLLLAGQPAIPRSPTLSASTRRACGRSVSGSWAGWKRS